MVKKIVTENSTGIIDPKRIYIYQVPEQLDVAKSLPIVKISHVTSNARTHSSNKLNYTKERLQIQYFYDANFKLDIESKILEIDRVLEEHGIYYSTGYDSYDPDFDGVLLISRQYNYRNKIN